MDSGGNLTPDLPSIKGKGQYKDASPKMLGNDLLGERVSSCVGGCLRSAGLLLSTLVLLLTVNNGSRTAWRVA